MKKFKLLFLALIILFSCDTGDKSSDTNFKIIIHEVNANEIPRGSKVMALVGATLIDGNGGTPLQNACVVVRNDKIRYSGNRSPGNYQRKRCY